MFNKQAILLPLLFIATLNTHAQSLPPVRLGVYAYPNVCMLKYTFPEDATDDFIDQQKTIESPKFSYSAGISVEVPLSDSWTLRPGLGYRNTGMRFRYPVYVAGYDIVSYTRTDNYHDLELPVSMVFKIGDRWFATGGCSGLLHVGSSTRTVMQNKNGDPVDLPQETSYEKYRALNVTVLSGFGYQLVQHEAFNLYAQPTAQYALLGHWMDMDVERRAFTAGLTVGVQFGGPGN